MNNNKEKLFKNPALQDTALSYDKTWSNTIPEFLKKFRNLYILEHKYLLLIRGYA